jgi:peptide/nickel transport system substrate-binding protein
MGLSTPILSAILIACLGNDDHEDATPAPPDEPTRPAPGEGTPTPEPTPTPSPDAAPTAASPAPAPSGTIVIASVTGDSGIGNPILTRNVTAIEYYVFSRLFSYDDEGTLQPELASDWSYSPDNRELTIRLIETVWHDGKPFDVDDVIFTFDTIRNETTETGRRANLRVAGEFILWERIDDRTLRITTSEPSAPLLYQLNQIAIVPEHLLAGSTNINIDPFNLAPVGTGPYRLAQWEQGQTIVLEANPTYFRGQPQNAGIVYRFFPTPDDAAVALAQGEIDMMFAPPQLHERYDNDPAVTVHRYVYFTPVTLALNHRHPLLQEPQMRRAIALAIDKERLVNEATAARGTVAHNQYAATGPLDRYNDYAGVPPLERDVAAANDILDALGYATGSAGIRETPAGERVSFNLLTFSGFREYETAQRLLREMLAEIGIDIVPLIVDYATLETFWTDPNDPPANRALELHEWPHPFEFDPDVYNELHSANHPPGYNIMWFADDEVDRLIDLGRTTTDPEERVSTYRALDRRRAEVLPCIPLYNALDGWVVSNRVQGVRASPYFRRYVLLGAPEWTKDE